MFWTSSPGGQNQAVIGEKEFFSAIRRENPNLSLFPVNSQDLVLKLDLYVLFLLKFLRCPDNQFVRVLDYIPDVIGKVSGPIRDVFPLLQQGYTGG
jgi:hypothetical protein